VILGVSGSGRKAGNAFQLLRAAMGQATGSTDSGPDIVHLSDLSFKGCVGCRACREAADSCLLEDDLTPVLGATASADALVLATPIYYGYASGLFKSYLDRWYSFRDGRRRLRVPEGRSALLILTQGHPDPAAYAWTRQSLERVLTAYGLKVHALIAPNLQEAGDVQRHPGLLDEARRLAALLRN
jgi:multimeric flavodoxin WrbA